jgi:hypothetical protein
MKDEMIKLESYCWYMDFLHALRCDIIYLLQKGDINENQYKMLDDRITEYLRKPTTDLNN